MVTSEFVPLVDRFSKEQLAEIVAESHSIKEVLCRLGYRTQNGRNSETVSKRIDEYSISTSHFRYKPPVKRDMQNVFCQDSTATQATLRRWYLRLSDCKKCEICGQTDTWNCKPLTMILDHKNGDNHDNRLSNLRWICPNCNSQLPTFAGRNSKIHSPIA